jgi:hypothetical protein
MRAALPALTHSRFSAEKSTLEKSRPAKPADFSRGSALERT